ncbi:MAG: hypothetical protein ACYSUC_07520 [Planctomycetota bacterium]|jgi:hypothetical protein
MDRTELTKKYKADKVALLGLFAVSLLAARLITSQRYAEPRAAGQELVGQIKQKGISSFLEGRGPQSFFLIKNAADHIMGFTMDVVTEAADAEFSIQLAGLLYTRGRYNRKQIMLFQTNDSVDEFSWRIKTVGPQGSSDTEIVLQEDGVLTVIKPNQNETESSYKPGHAAIPDFLLDLVFRQLLESDHIKIIVDTITNKGNIVQVVISRRIPEDLRPPQTDAAYELYVQYLDDRRRSQHVILDDQGWIESVEQNGIYFERANREKVLGQFPEWRDYVLDTNKILEPNQP